MTGRFVFNRWLLLSISIATVSSVLVAMAEEMEPTSKSYSLRSSLDKLLQWRRRSQRGGESEGEGGPRMAVAAALCFVAAGVSSAGGVGGGSLFLPILNLVARIDLKRASKYSAFMVAGNAASNVLYSVFSASTGAGGGHLIDYDIALLSEPCMLLGVTLGVICNIAFPEWLVTLLFVVILAGSTFKTCRAGGRRWREESEEMREKKGEKVGGVEEGGKDLEKPLLPEEGGPPRRFPLKKVAFLLMVWLCFFLLQFLRGDKEGKGIIKIKRCGLGYWLTTSSQVPVALLFTTYIMYANDRQQRRRRRQGDDHKSFDVPQTVVEDLPKIIFPIAALLAGVLGGLFGIGGGLLMNPVLLQIGISPQITASTSCFMVFFSASMSSMQYLMLGMKEVNQALLMAAGCSVTSMAGVILIQRAVGKYGRASLIIFTLSTVMVLSSISITGFGIIDIWKDYMDGRSLGFKLPC
ncbi:unnamed protein product [Spirodela intermedia]|uniref:Uncharacterized protein n=1 Tax=Spirodela intermedia TaxID=51605 RepID=A0A7I8L6M0_SPIIN|nr:unnamed protein product [Spirodela intermedia]